MGKVSQSQPALSRNSQSHVRRHDKRETPLVPWWKTILVGNINESAINVMMHPDSNLEDVEEAIEQKERIKSFLVGHFQYVENIRFDGLQSVVRIFEDPVGWMLTSKLFDIFRRRASSVEL